MTRRLRLLGWVVVTGLSVLFVVLYLHNFGDRIADLEGDLHDAEIRAEENAASDLVERAGGHVGRPEATSLPAAAAWVDALLADDERRDTVRAQARELAEQEFSLAGCADRFEAVLERGAR